jgi:micrococcal nuclease
MSHYPRLLLFTTLIVGLSSTPLASAEGFTGKVVGESDGDTITVMHQGRGERIRLHGIDAPERGQPFTNRAKQFVSDLATTRKWESRPKDKTATSPRLPTWFCPMAAFWITRLWRLAGMAWWFKRYAPNDPTLEGLEFQAKEAKRGIWVLRDPMPPWEFRRNKPAPYTEKEWCLTGFMRLKTSFFWISMGLLLNLLQDAIQGSPDRAKGNKPKHKRNQQ